MKKFMLAALAAALVLTLGGCAGGTPAAPAETTVHLQQEAEPDTITVTGRAGMEATPDVAKISVGVTSRASTPTAAREQNTTAVNATLDALKELGIEDRDIQTTNMNMWTSYNNNGGISGYRMSTDLAIYVREIDRAGEVVDAAIAAGSNELNGVEYLLSNEDEMYNEALTDAIDLARQKAESMAAAAGKTVGQVRRIEETSRAVATVREYGVNADTGGVSFNEAKADTVIRPGSSTISAQVQVVFEIS